MVTQFRYFCFLQKIIFLLFASCVLLINITLRSCPCDVKILKLIFETSDGNDFPEDNHLFKIQQ